ncbi:olfactory receptor 52K1-like [Lepisosteus oculatus]
MWEWEEQQRTPVKVDAPSEGAEALVVATHSSNSIYKYADDTAIFGHITSHDETAYRDEVRNLVEGCLDNNISLNVSKPEELVIDFRKQGGDHTPLHINGVAAEMVNWLFGNSNSEITADMQGYQGGNFSHTEFLLIGFHELKEQRWLLFFPFCLMFMLSTVANSALIFVITAQRSLHSPMCVLIGAMACVDLSLPVFFVPKMLLSLLFNWDAISLLGCLVQMFFIHFVGSFQSSILLWMALDRYAAICIPLRYNEYTNTSSSLKFIVAAVLRNGIFILVIVILAGNLPYCSSNVIDHCFCEHMALVSVANGSTVINSSVGLGAVFCVTTLDFVCIVVSYGKIFISVFKTTTGKSSRKAIHTCTTHIIVMCVTYFSAMTAFFTYRVKNSISPNIRVLISTMYLLFPSCFNPIIYGIRTKEIREQILKLIKRTKVDQTSFKVSSLMQN